MLRLGMGMKEANKGQNLRGRLCQDECEGRKGGNRKEET